MSGSSQPPSATFSPVHSTAEWGGRPTRAEIDLDVIAANVRALKYHIGDTKLMAVVKANAYGHGAYEVVHAALVSGADWLGVYTVAEGVELRQSRIAAPILVFGPFSRAEASCFPDHNLTATIGSEDAARVLQAASRDRPVAFHLKLDTGLNRSGIATARALSLMRDVARYGNLDFQGIFTHFASADESEQGVTWDQIASFEASIAELESEGFRCGLKHAANSAATLQFPESHFDMVRCGIAIYGYYPSHEVCRDVPLHPALSLLSTVVRLHRIPCGAGVGYGHEFRADRDSEIALIPIGYGDGLSRSLGNGRGRVIIRGHFAPVVGRVSMDQITVDVTTIPYVSVGDDVILIGAQREETQSAEDLATAAGTISYDILTALLPRVPRLYVGGSELLKAI